MILEGFEFFKKICLKKPLHKNIPSVKSDTKCPHSLKHIWLWSSADLDDGNERNERTTSYFDD